MRAEGPLSPGSASLDVTLGASAGLIPMLALSGDKRLTTPRATRSGHTLGSGLPCSHNRCSLWEALLCQGCACQLWPSSGAKCFYWNQPSAGSQFSFLPGWNGGMTHAHWAPCLVLNASCMASLCNSQLSCAKLTLLFLLYG